MLCGDLSCSIALCQLQDINKQDHGLMLYGFYDSLSLHKVTTWSEARNVSIPTDSHKVSLLPMKCMTLNLFLHFARDVNVVKGFFFFLQEWIYYLNAGSIINISYSVYSSSSIFLVIADGMQMISRFNEYPSFSTLFFVVLIIKWNLISHDSVSHWAILVVVFDGLSYLDAFTHDDVFYSLRCIPCA